MKKNFLLILVFVGLASYTHAQHEFSIAVGANASPITGPDDGATLYDLGSINASVNAQTDAQMGLTASVQYAYYATPHLKPYLKYARTSVNCNSSTVVVINSSDEPFSQETRDVDYNILRTSLSYGLAYEWNNGFGISLGITSNNLNKLTLDGIGQDQYFAEDLVDLNSNFTIEDEHDLNTSSSNLEFGLIYRIGNFTIEFLQQTASLEEVSDYWITSVWNPTNDSPGTVGTSNFLLGYSYFISK
jgi:hypothetical protein